MALTLGRRPAQKFQKCVALGALYAIQTYPVAHATGFTWGRQLPLAHEQHRRCLAASSGGMGLTQTSVPNSKPAARVVRGRISTYQ